MQIRDLIKQNRDIMTPRLESFVRTLSLYQAQGLIRAMRADAKKMAVDAEVDGAMGAGRLSLVRDPAKRGAFNMTPTQARARAGDAA